MRKNNGFLDETMNKILKYYKFTSVKKILQGKWCHRTDKEQDPTERKH